MSPKGILIVGSAAFILFGGLFSAVPGIGVDETAFRYREYDSDAPVGTIVTWEKAASCKEKGDRIQSRYNDHPASLGSEWLVYDETYLDEAHRMAKCLGVWGPVSLRIVDAVRGTHYRVHEGQSCAGLQCAGWREGVWR